MGKILNIVIVILLLAALVYGYMQFTSSDVTDSEGLSTSTGTSLPGSPALLDSTGATDQGDFVSLLLDLKQISLDTAFLTSSLFSSLQDFSRDIPPQNIGRRNPFAPTGANEVARPRSTQAAQVSAFTTSPPTSPSTGQQSVAPAFTPPEDTLPPEDTPPPPQDDTLPPPDSFPLDGGL